MSEYKIFTSESVSEGHPDKMADQISDAVLDAMLKDDPDSRVACETLVKDNLVVLAGEITSGSEPDLEALTRKVILDIGYDSIDVGCDGNTCEVVNAIGKQSQDIAQGVNEGEGEDLEQQEGDEDELEREHRVEHLLQQGCHTYEIPLTAVAEEYNYIWLM